MNSARDLTDRLTDLLRRERTALADFLVALADFDRRRLWAELGYSSLFYFLHRELGLSKGAAFYRKTAAALIQKFPDLVEPLRDGRLCLTSVVELAKVLTPENRAEILPRFFQLSKREAKAVSAELRPVEAAPHREVVTAVRVPARAAALGPREGTPQEDRTRAEQAVHPGEPPARVVHPGEPNGPALQKAACRTEAPSAPTRLPPTEVVPLTADLSRLHVTVSRRFLEKLEAAKAALSHSHPGAGAQEILEAGLNLLLERHAKRRGLVKKPRREPPPAKPGRVPAHVMRAVWERDGGKCQWPLASGGVCGSTHQVELDHVVARGRGGASTIDNTRLLCRLHNDLAARRVYGDAWMNQFTRGLAEPSPGDSPVPP